MSHQEFATVPTEHIKRALLNRVAWAGSVRFAQIMGVVLILCMAEAGAVEMPELAKKNDCVNCHAINERIVGPAWMDVSRKYKDDPKAEEKLMARVSKGSSGFFGLIHMPANDPDGRKQDEIRTLVRFILGLSKGEDGTGTGSGGAGKPR